MAYINTDHQLETSQPLISNTLLSFSGDVDSLGQYKLLDDQLDKSVANRNPWFSGSTDYEPIVSFTNAADNFEGRQGQWLEEASFNIDESLSRLGILGVSPTSETIMNLEFERGGSFQMDTAEMTAPIQDMTPLKCSEPGCNDQRIYSTLAMLRKHQGKHSRPYACKHSSCNYRRFGDKAGLARHSREVHGTEVHYCPFVSCNRHTRGFPRKYNLIQHQRNSHGDRQTRHANHSVQQSHSKSQTTSIEPPENGNVPFELVQARNGDMDRDSNKESLVKKMDASSLGLDKLEKKLRDLRAARTEIDRDIETLERALGLLEAHSEVS